MLTKIVLVFFGYQISNFSLDLLKQPITSNLKISILKQYMEHGIYEIEDLYNMNKTLDQFDITFEQGKNIMVYFNYSYYYKYRCNQKKGTGNMAQVGGALNVHRLITKSWSKKKKKIPGLN